MNLEYAGTPRLTAKEKLSSLTGGGASYETCFHLGGKFVRKLWENEPSMAEAEKEVAKAFSNVVM